MVLYSFSWMEQTALGLLLLRRAGHVHAFAITEVQEIYMF